MGDFSTRDDGTLSTLGEFGLIDRIANILGTTTAAVVGIGDDAAVLDGPGDEYLLATVDMLVENVHFRRSSDPIDVGRRAFEVSASDIASMGGTPTFALSSIAVPSDLPLHFLDGLYKGMAMSCSQHGASVVGGNVTRTAGPVAVDLTLLGTVPKSELIRRTGAKSGDILAVTGCLGNAAAARLVVEGGLFRQDSKMQAWQRECAVPRARVSEGRVLAASRLVHAMLDLSDGIASDVHHLCEASGVGALIDESKLPFSEEVRRVANEAGTVASDLALSGGEDYELLMALESGSVEAVRALLHIPLTVVGIVSTPDEGILLRHGDGKVADLKPTGWVHF